MRISDLFKLIRQFTVILFIFSTVLQPIVAETLEVLSWKFSQGQVKDNALLDGSGKYPLAIDGHPRFTREGGEAWVLDGEVSSATAKLNPADLSQTEISLIAWVLVAEIGEKEIIAELVDSNQNRLVLAADEDRFMFSISSKEGSKTAKSSTPFITGRWYLVGGIFDGSSISIYVNTIDKGSEAYIQDNITFGETVELRIGYSDEGSKLKGMINEVAIYNQALTTHHFSAGLAGKRETLPDAPESVFGPFMEILGPFIELQPDDATPWLSALVSWQTPEPMDCTLEFGLGAAKVDLFDCFLGARIPINQLDDNKTSATGNIERLNRKHSILLEDIDPEKSYYLRIRGHGEDGKEQVSQAYEFDGQFNYTEQSQPVRDVPYPSNGIDPSLYRSFAHRVVTDTGITRGYCLIVEANEGRLAYELAQRTQLKIIAVDKDPEDVQKARQFLDRADIYGGRVTVFEGTTDNLGPYFANLILSDETLTSGKMPGRLSDIYAHLRPCGGTIYLGQAGLSPQLTSAKIETWIDDMDLATGNTRLEKDNGIFWIHRRGALPGAGEWTHQYAGPANNACSQDSLIKGEVEVLWWGRPGPRPMPDRGSRNPAPLFANGRLLVQGNRVFFGIDAYNGTILWSFQAPAFRRANMPRDCSNMLVSGDQLYIASGSYCYVINAQTGEREEIFSVLDPSIGDHKVNWGYLALSNGLLIGSGTFDGAQYFGDQGEWYEGGSDHEAGKVTGEYIFALDQNSGEVIWKHDAGVLINSTVTIHKQTVYLLESRQANSKPNFSGRFPAELPSDLHIVALDAQTGVEKWTRSVDYSDIRFMVYLAAAQNTLVAAGTDKDKNFHTFAYDTEMGQPLWNHKEQTKKTHHSGHLSHPTIVGNRLYVNKFSFDLRSGEVLNLDPFDWHGCGTMSAGQHTIFHRYEFHGMMDIETGQRTELLGVRSGCWLGLIPAGGMLLAPESGSGCSCRHALQTSVAYIPKQ